MAQSALRPLSIGEILDGAFALYRRHFLTFFGTQVAILAPAIAVSFLDNSASQLVLMVLSIPAIAAAVWQTSELTLGRRIELRAAVKVGIRKFFPVLGALISLGFIVGICIVPMYVFINLGWIRTFFIALPLSLVPLFAFWIMFFALVQVITIEGNFKTCLQRSRKLARRSWRKIGLVYLISTLIGLVPAVALGAAQVTTALWNYQPGDSIDQGGPLASALHLLVQALTNPFSMGVMTLLYYDQRVRKEGLDVELAAAAIPETPRETVPAAGAAGGAGAREDGAPPEESS